VRVRLLGSFEVEGVPERQLGSRKGRTVLKLLALARGAPVPVDRIADVLWGDDQPSRPADQVGVLVSRLRGVLGAERIARSDAGYALVADWIDVEEVVALGAASAEALAAGRRGAARAAADPAARCCPTRTGRGRRPSGGPCRPPSHASCDWPSTRLSPPVTTVPRRRWPSRDCSVIPTTRRCSAP
jgi:hypothetical protein